MTDNFERYREFITLCGGLPDNNDHGNLDKYYVIELMRRGKDNPDMSAANYHFRNYYVYSWKDLDRYEEEVKSVCRLLNLRAYCSVNYKMMSQVALDTMAESARRLANHDYKRFYSIFESCSGKYVDHNDSKWVVDLDDIKMDDWRVEEVEKIVERMESGHEKNVIYKMPTKSGLHLITHPFNMSRFIWTMKDREDLGLFPDVKKNHITLLFEDLK